MKKFAKDLIIFWIIFFSIGLIMGATRHVLKNGGTIKGTPKELILFMSELISNSYTLISSPLIVTNTFQLKSGFNYSNNFTGSKDYLLLSSWNDSIGQSVVKLVRINDGKVLHLWVPDINAMNRYFNLGITNGFKNGLTKRSTILLHPLLQSDGSLILGAGSIFKIDKDSKIIWGNKSSHHHSIEPDADGNIWICCNNPSSTKSKKYRIVNDAIMKISSDSGKIIFEKSVFDILYENGYELSHFLINTQIESDFEYLDFGHLNDVHPVNKESKYWKSGDLFLSLRNQNMVLLYRPSTNKIIWIKQGPWLHQHDIDIIDSTRIGVFGNDVIDAKVSNQNDRFINGHNNKYIYDFSKDETTTPYTEFFKTANIGTYTEGESRIFKNGDIFVEEQNNGRIIYGNQKEEIWSYIEKIGEKKVSLFHWSRYITEEEFNKLTFINKPVK